MVCHVGRRVFRALATPIVVAVVFAVAAVTIGASPSAARTADPAAEQEDEPRSAQADEPASEQEDEPPFAQADAPVVDATSYPSIQAALDSLRHSGGSVYISAGVHVLPKKLRVYSNVTVFGEGVDVTVLQLAEGVVDHLMSNSSLSGGNSGIVIRDLTLAGSRVGTKSCCFGLRLVNVRDSLVFNVASDGFSKDGFYLGHYRQLGVYSTRLSGCRAANNGRNGIALVHGTGNVIENCLVENNNRAESEQVAGIDLEPDAGLDVSDNWVIGNVASGQNVGIQLYAFDRARATLTNNAVCGNTATGNVNAGIWDRGSSGNIFVGNSTWENGNNFLVSASARVGSGYAGACEVPPL